MGLAEGRESEFRSTMASVILKAQYDGKHIVLDEPFDLPPNVPFLISIFGQDADQAAWTALGVSCLSRAYSEDEPDYSDANLRHL